MKLAFDTSQTAGSIAIWDGGKIIWSSAFEISVTHSETLMPQVDAALKFCSFTPADITAVLLTLGPGSFTGLRIGLATAKGIAYGLRIPLWSFSTLKLLALQRHNCGRPILAVLDAKMREVYAALYDSQLAEIVAPRVCVPEEIAQWDLGEPYLLGSGANLVEGQLAERGVKTISVLPQPLSAAGLFTLAELFPQNPVYDFAALAALEPDYLRESTAQIRLRNATPR